MQNPFIQSSPLRNLSLVLCALLHGLNHGLQLMLPPLYLSIRDDLGLDGLGPVMLFGTIYFVTYAASSFPYGFLGDRYSKKRILVFGALLNSIAFLVAAGTKSYAVFVAAMVLGGVGGGAYHPVANALISNLFKGMVGRAFGLIGMGASLGLFLGPFASGSIGEQFGWRMSCLAFGLFGCGVAAAFGLIMPEEGAAKTQEAERAILWRSLFVPFLAVIIVYGLRDFCFWGTTYLTPALSQENLGFSKKMAGALIGFMSLTGIVSQPLAGTLSDRLGRRRIIFISLVIGSVTVFFLPYLNSTLIFAGAFVGGFILLGTIPMLDALAAEIAPPSVRGKVFGFIMTFGLMLGALSPYAAGLLHDLTGGYQVRYLVLSVAGLAGAGLVFTIPAKRAHA